MESNSLPYELVEVKFISHVGLKNKSVRLDRGILKYPGSILDGEPVYVDSETKKLKYGFGKTKTVYFLAKDEEENEFPTLKELIEFHTAAYLEQPDTK